MSRLIAAPHAADAVLYRVVQSNATYVSGVTFRTGSIDGRSADDVACANLADMSEGIDGAELSLFRLTAAGRELVATATRGCYIPVQA